MASATCWVQCRSMAEPRIIPRAEHMLSRRDIDPDALKVLYPAPPGRSRRLSGRRQRSGPPDRPQAQRLRRRHIRAPVSDQTTVSKLLDHRPPLPSGSRQVRTKVIEVATFRRQVAPGDEPVQEGVPAPAESAPETRDHLIHRDNTFGTPEEDAFRRRLHDQCVVLRHRLVLGHRLRGRTGGFAAPASMRCDRRPRCALSRGSGSDDERRRAGVTARFHESISRCWMPLQRHRLEIARSSAPRVLENTTRSCDQARRRKRSASWLVWDCSSRFRRNCTGAVESLWHSLAALDRYPSPVRVRLRHAHECNPLRQSAHALWFLPLPRAWSENQPSRGRVVEAVDRASASGNGGHAVGSAHRHAERSPRLGPRLGRVAAGSPRHRASSAITFPSATPSRPRRQPRARASLTHRSIFREALTWLEIHGGVADTVEQWQVLLMAGSLSPDSPATSRKEGRPLRGRRRRRRRRLRPASS